MKRSEKILKKNNIQGDFSWIERETIKNTTLLTHIIDNDLKHLWRWILVVVGLVAGLYAKSFITGG